LPRLLAASERTRLGGTLNLTAQVLSGEQMLRPILDDFLDAFPTVSAKLLLCDRPVNLIDEGIDASHCGLGIYLTHRWSPFGSAKFVGSSSLPSYLATPN
jgi:DNA-binding transcriptional LysR family regulator